MKQDEAARADTSALVWFRRDLRASDHAALYHALRGHARVYCAFVFDTDILDALPRADRRVAFIHASVVALDERLRAMAGHAQAGLVVRHGAATHEIPALAARLEVEAVYANHDDEPAALLRDAAVRDTLRAQGRRLRTFKDHVVFERSEVLTQAGQPFSVFTPYKQAWLRKLDDFYLSAYPVERHAQALAPLPRGMAPGVPALATLKFEAVELPLPAGEAGAATLLEDFEKRIGKYATARDFPGVKGPSYLSTHLRFGTLSPRLAVRTAWGHVQRGSEGAATWLSELVWRDFYMQILHHHPHVVERSFKPAYDAIAWDEGPQAEALFAAWCEGRTGYPLVDAAMAQINQTGYMHNRLRMVVASFLTKDLGLDWRWGERYFARQLIDYDLAANNGGWQWAASTGCDAQPYFRIFNPVSQSEKFDPEGRFILRYLPQLAGLPDKLLHAPWRGTADALDAAGVRLGENYPLPIVDHAEARERTLARYAVVKAPRTAP